MVTIYYIKGILDKFFLPILIKKDYRYKNYEHFTNYNFKTKPILSNEGVKFILKFQIFGSNYKID